MPKGPQGQDSRRLFSYATSRMFIGVGIVLGAVFGWVTHNFASGVILGLVAAIVPLAATQLWNDYA